MEENEHLQDGLAATEAEFQEQETEYAEVDVDPIKMEVDMDEIVSAEELTELTEELQVDETKAENKDSVFYEELTAETAEVEENMEGEAEEEDFQNFSEEKVKKNKSKKGKYISLTCIVDVNNQNELDKIYLKLNTFLLYKVFIVYLVFI